MPNSLSLQMPCSMGEERNIPALLSLPAPQRIGNLRVHPLRLAELLAWLRTAMTQPEPRMVFYANIHAVNLAEADGALAAAYADADLVFCDGYGLRLGAALLGRPLPERFTPPDWIDQLLTICMHDQRRVFLLGARPEVVATALRRLQHQYQGLALAGHHGYLFEAAGNEAAALEAIRAFQPHLLLVGMGMPLQEAWIASQRANLGIPVMMSVGALIDHLGGGAVRGPRWLTDHGFEWLCRLWYEPQRLWRRYLLGNPAFLLLIVRQAVAERMGRKP